MVYSYRQLCPLKDFFGWHCSALNLTFYIALETTEKQGHHQVAGKVLRTLLGANSDAHIDFVLWNNTFLQ